MKHWKLIIVDAVDWIIVAVMMCTVIPLMMALRLFVALTDKGEKR